VRRWDSNQARRSRATTREREPSGRGSNPSPRIVAFAALTSFACKSYPTRRPRRLAGARRDSLVEDAKSTPHSLRESFALPSCSKMRTFSASRDGRAVSYDFVRFVFTRHCRVNGSLHHWCNGSHEDSGRSSARAPRALGEQPHSGSLNRSLG